MADAMKPAGQHVQQEPTEELVGRQCHRPIPLCSLTAVVLVAERHPTRVERDQPSVGDRDPVGKRDRYASTAAGPANGGLA